MSAFTGVGRTLNGAATEPEKEKEEIDDPVRYHFAFFGYHNINAIV